MKQLDDYPGLQARDGWFERAYAVGNQVARVRFVPQLVDPGLAAQVNIPTIPSVLSVHISASLVDRDGQVKTVAGRGLFQDAESHSWQVADGAALDVEAWLTEKAAEVVAKLINAAAIWRACELLIPPVPLAIEEASVPLLLPAPAAGEDAEERRP